MSREYDAKFIIVGDGAAGKTTLLVAYQRNEFPTEFLPSVADIHNMTVRCDNSDTRISMWDTAGSEEYDRLRPLSYPSTSVFILVFSCAAPASFDNVRSKWYPEIRHHARNTPYILVATKTDLKHDDNTEEFLRRTHGRGVITSEEGLNLSTEIGAYGYYETSSVRMEGLTEVFEACIRAYRTGAKPENSEGRERAQKLSKCVLL